MTGRGVCFNINDMNENPDPVVWRELLIESVEKVLLKADVRDEKQHTNIHTVLDFILNVSERFPEIFVRSNRLNGPNFNNVESLTNWIISHSIQISSVLPKLHIFCEGKAKSLLFKKHVEMELKISNMLSAFMHLVRIHNFSHFMDILKNFVTSLFNVFDALEIFLEERFHAAIPLKEFQNVSILDEEFKEITVLLNDSDACFQLLVVILKVIQDNLTCSSLFSHILHNLWPLVLKMVQIGGYALKSASLEFIRNLVEFSKPSLEQYLDLVDMLFEMIGQLPSIAIDKQTLQLQQEICRSLQDIVKSKEIFYLHKMPIARCIYYNLMEIFREPGLDKYNENMKLTFVTSVTECCKFMCSRSEDQFQNNISQLVNVGCELLTFVASSQDDYFIKCCQQFMLQVTKAEVEHYFCKQKNPECSSESTILEMRELQCSAKDVSQMSQHLFAVLLETITSFEASLCSQNFEYCERYLTLIGWFCETLSLSSGLVVKYISNEEKSLFRPCLCDESLRLLCLLFKFVGEISNNKEAVRRCFKKITSLLICISYMSDLFDLDFELCSFIIGFASLPWLSSEMSCLDLKLKDPKTFFKLSDHVSDYFDEKTLSDCIYLLCTTSKPHLAHQWRFHAMRKAWSDTKTHLKCAILENVCIARHRISTFGSQFTIEILEEAVRSSDESMELSVVKALKDLLCSLSGHAQIMRPVVPFASEDDLKMNIFFSCNECHFLKDAHLMETSPIVVPSTSNSHACSVLRVLKGLFHSGHPAVRLGLVNCFKVFYMHIQRFFESNKTLLLEFVEEGLLMMKDADREVRMAFSKVVCHLLPKKINKEAVEEMIVRWINECIDITCNSASFVETFLVTLSRLAWVCDGELLLTCVSILLNIYFFPVDDKLELMAAKHLEQICSHHDTTMDFLFRRFAKPICQAITICLYETKQMKPNWNVLEFLKKVANIFLFESARSFLKKNEGLILPFLIMKADKTASILLKHLSQIMDDKSCQNCLIRTIGQIFCHLVITAKSKEDHKNAFIFLEEESGLSLYELLNYASHVDSYLLVYLSERREQVLQGLEIWIDVKRYFAENQPEVRRCSQEELAESLQPNLLGILVHFDKYLNDYGTSMNDKLKAYGSLKSLIELMGEKHITQVRIRFMKTLKIGLQFRDEQFAKLCCEVWSTFVRTVKLSSLGSMLTQVVVFLLPLFNQFPSHVGKIFNYLIVENRETLHPHLGDLYFVPVAPELKEVNAVLKLYQEGEYSCKGLTNQIERLLKGISHDSIEVRQMALSKLKELLKRSKSEVRNLILGNELMDPIMSQMVTILLYGCRESDMTIRNLTAQCLGEIGAIDPGRVELLSASKSPRMDYLGTLEGDNFCMQLISELAKAFLRVDDSVQDCVAYAIQELLKICGVEVDNEKWNQFSEDALEILTPLLKSRYKVNLIRNWGDLQKPIYGSEKAKTFERWVCTLTGYLGSMMSTEKCKTVFDACYGVLRSDSQVALLLLPVISIQILLENNPEHCEMLLKEILTILNDCQHGFNGGYDREEQSNCISVSDIRHMCAQTIFTLFDRIARHLRQQSALHTLFGDAKKDKKAVLEKNIESMTSFLVKVPEQILSVASFNCGAYTRSLKHYELFIKSSNQNLADNSEFVDFLLKLYLALDEPDGVSGVMALQQVQPSLTQQIHCFESVGLLSDASTCYDRAMQSDPTNLALKKGLLKIRLAHGELNSVLNLANGMINNDSSANQTLNRFRVEAAWKLGEWDKLELYLDSENQSIDWNVGLGRLLTSIKSKDLQGFNENITPLRLSVMVPLSAASIEMGSYHMGYESIIRLHMLTEVEDGASFLFNYHSNDSKDSVPVSDWLDKTIRTWQDRMEICQNSYKAISPILDLHRVLLKLVRHETGVDVEENISSCWLTSARIARECGLIQTAHSSLLSVGDHHMPEFSMERAAWFWNKGDFGLSRCCLEKTYLVLSNDKTFKSVEKNRTNLSKLLLQLTRYNDEASSLESNSIMKLFKEVRELNPRCEDSYFYCGKFYDKILCSILEQEKNDKKGQFVNLVITHFLQSLLYGNQYIFQSLPRLLGLWLDYTAGFIEKQEVLAKSDNADKINKAIVNGWIKLPAYQFLLVLPQLISRICHSHAEVFGILKDIIVRVTKEFPQQAMWHMVAVSKSPYHMRAKRCQEIFNKAKSGNPELAKFLQDATKMADLLIDLCNKECKENSINISQHFKPLLRFLNDKDLSQILMPLQKQMIPTLPSLSNRDDLAKHSAFSSSPVYIAGIEDKVEVLNSLQKPKKVTFKGSDGKNYVMLCKPKDDLRKDARLMEFTNLVNRCLKKHQDSRKRNLHIRTYTVTPLDEDCGMLEWVSNTGGLRPVLLKLYKEKGLQMSGSEMKNYMLPSADPMEFKLKIFREKLLPKHPAIFSEWFLRVFPDPTSWYSARRAFGRTTAVMSMVGYVLGLGDRHGENILLDSTCGDCVHVDFSCLFNKGETFEYPEVVPFRLTHNMVEGMGVLGYEGIFRKSCEVTLKVMREEMDSLMSILKTFIFDPLVEWKKPAGGRNNPRESGEIVNEQAKSHVSNIEDRLRGSMRQRYIGLPLSVEGQVSSLIKEATDEKNLCRMYIGWAAFM